MNKTVPFICVNYNTEDETFLYIENVLSLENSNVARIIVVDNSPNTKSFESIKRYVEEKNLSEKVILFHVENKGYFHGLNEGLKKARELGIDFKRAVIGNNDITFRQDFISKIQALLISKETMVIAPDVVTTLGFHENPHVIKKKSKIHKLKYDLFYSNFHVARLLRLIKKDQRPKRPHDPQPKYIFSGIGALYILTENFFDKFDLLWDQVFLYGEEAVLSGQIESAKGKILYEPTLICNHNESSTTGKMDSRNKYEITRKSYKIYRKYI